MKRGGIGICVFVFAAILATDAGAEDQEWNGLMNRGYEMQAAGNYAKAADFYAQAARAAPSGTHDLRLAAALNALATQYEELGKFADAERQWRRALTMVERAEGRNSLDYAELLANLGLLQVQKGMSGQAETFFREAMATAGPDISPADPRVAVMRNGLSQVLIRSGRYDEAEKLLNETLEALRSQTPPRVRAIASALNNLGAIDRAKGRHREAAGYFEQAIAAVEPELGQDNPYLLRISSNLANTYALLGRTSDADTLFQKSLDSAERKLGGSHPLCGWIMTSYARFLRKTGRKQQAKLLEARSRDVLTENAQQNGAGMTVDVSEFRSSHGPAPAR
jgi:tetratricopeptide (TPR) repeat protein